MSEAEERRRRDERQRLGLDETDVASLHEGLRATDRPSPAAAAPATVSPAAPATGEPAAIAWLLNWLWNATLKRLCRERGLAVGGNKAELVGRLLSDSATLSVLLEALTLDELLPLAEACGLAKSGSRAEVIPRIGRFLVEFNAPARALVDAVWSRFQAAGLPFPPAGEGSVAPNPVAAIVQGEDAFSIGAGEFAYLTLWFHGWADGQATIAFGLYTWLDDGDPDWEACRDRVASHLDPAFIHEVATAFLGLAARVARQIA